MKDKSEIINGVYIGPVDYEGDGIVSIPYKTYVAFREVFKEKADSEYVAYPMLVGGSVMFCSEERAAIYDRAMTKLDHNETGRKIKWFFHRTLRCHIHQKMSFPEDMVRFDEYSLLRLYYEEKENDKVLYLIDSRYFDILSDENMNT